MGDLAILWRRLDKPGHESARLFFQPPNWHLTGTAVFAHEQQPCRLDYLVVCSSAWQTLSGRVSGWVGNEIIDIELSADRDRHWTLNGKDSAVVSGCTDIDFGFTPSTNLLPIRRLGLSVGEEARVRAAWLRFPGFTLEPLEQIYRRTDVHLYRYESGGGRFATDLEVNAAGFVTRYPNFFEVEQTSTTDD